MHATITAAIVFATVTLWQNPAVADSDDRYKIVLSINGIQVQGSQEIALAIIGKTAAEANAILNAEPFPVSATAPFQLSVQVIDPSGQSVDFTGSSRLSYEGFGCISTSLAGTARFAPSSSCAGRETPSLWVVFNDENGQPIAVNEYILRVVE